MTELAHVRIGTSRSSQIRKPQRNSSARVQAIRVEVCFERWQADDTGVIAHFTPERLSLITTRRNSKNSILEQPDMGKERQIPNVADSASRSLAMTFSHL
jgi:hypothetical protein